MEGERGEVEQVLEAVAATAREQEEALDRALALTNAALRHGDSPASAGDAPASPAPSSGVPGDERQRWWLAARLRLLQHQERLGTVLALHNG